MVPIICFVGRHNAGKTTVLKKLITLLTQQGLKIAFIKHSHHDLDILHGQDSEMALQAGADYAVASSPRLQIQYRRYSEEPSLAELIAAVPADIDLVIAEGFKKEPLPKIEVVRQAIDPVPMFLPHTLALISDFPVESGIPLIPADDTEALARFVCLFSRLSQ